MLFGTSPSRCKHVVGVVQQIAICTWTGPGETEGERDEERGLQNDGGSEGRGRTKERVFKST